MPPASPLVAGRRRRDDRSKGREEERRTGEHEHGRAAATRSRGQGPSNIGPSHSWLMGLRPLVVLLLPENDGPHSTAQILFSDKIISISKKKDKILFFETDKDKIFFRMMRCPAVLQVRLVDERTMLSGFHRRRLLQGDLIRARGDHC